MKFSVVSVLIFLMTFSLQAQDGFPKLIADFENYNETNYQEKIFVHTDRTFYLTGDYIWMKVYLVNGVNHKPSFLSKIVYVEILDAANKPVLQSKIAIQDGSGYTALFLPATLNSGHYTFRAYTRWMRNFSEDMFFSKTITVVNTFKMPEKMEPTMTEGSLDIQFFPEGGDLVTGLKSKVAFRMVDQNGNGVDRNGAILNARNDTVTRFRPLKFGLGSFYLTPVENETYHAVIKNSLGKIMERSFPVAKANGYVMSLTKNGEQMEIKIRTNIGAATKMYLLAHTRGVVKETLVRNFSNGEVDFVIDQGKLDEAVSHLTLFDENIRPVCERLYFKQFSSPLKIDASVNEKQFSKRRKVTVDVATHLRTQNLPVDLSVSVYRLDSLQAEDPINIVNQLLLNSELSGNIESPSFYFSNDKDVNQAADNLMLTQGWRHFKWNAVSESKEELPFIPEYRGHIITGSIKNKITGENAVNIPVYLSVPGKVFHLRSSRSDENGELHFELNNFYGTNRIIAQPNTSVDSIYTIAIASPFVDKYSKTSLPRFYLGSESGGVLLRRSVNMQMVNAYHERVKDIILSSDSLNFYRIPDAHYELDKYTRFSVMEDVMREYVRGVFVKKQKQVFSFGMVNEMARLENKDFRMNPLILIDGVPVFHTNRIMAYDPLKVKSMDVITQRYFYGPLTIDGIVSYRTYKGDLKDFRMDERTLVEQYNGTEWQREFFSPVYEVNNDETNRVPDYRDLLYWSPSLKSNKGGKAQINFYTSDQIGQYLINIQGITSDGDIANASYRISVEDK